MRALFLAAALAASASAASAQGPNNTRLMGALTAVSPTQVTIKPANGAAATVALSSTAQVIVARPINVATIKPGAYVATANTNIDDKSGKSVELRMYGPNQRGANFSRPMNQPNTTMTNGTVESVKKGKDGWELSVYIPGGTRKIIIPNDVKVIGNFEGTPKDLKVGETVTVNAGKDAGGGLITNRVTVNRS